LGEFEGELKTAIQVEDLRTGERRLLASREAVDCQGPKLGSWQFSEAALAWGDERLREASPCDLLVVDELGPLEFERGEGWRSGFAAITDGVYRQALVVVRPEYLHVARQRWPEARVLRVFK
jgi:nucleoside-triphosphatase THEP1